MTKKFISEAYKRSKRLNDRWTFLVITALFAASCSQTGKLHEHRTLNSTLWVQTAAEYDAICRQAYAAASSQFDQIRDLPSELPKAIIADVDETVLDNSPFQARMIVQNSNYDPTAWDKWVKEAQAEAVPGALEFFRKADDLGIRIFYITNRDASNEDVTRENLQSLGFPFSDEEDRLLMKNERPEWTSSKTERRKIVSENNDVIMLFGDDLNDFIPAKNISIQERDQLIRENDSKFGRVWFILPNPNYGSWERALYDFRNDLNEAEAHSARQRSLETKNND